MKWGNPWPRRVIGTLNTIALGVVGNFATEWLRSLGPSPLRDTVAALLPLVVIVGMVVIAVSVVLAERPSRAEAPRQVSDDSSDERDKRLAELELEKASEQRRMLGSALKDMANEARGIRSDHEQPAETFHGRQGSADAWARADAWDTKVKRVLGRDAADDPTLLREFSAAIDPIALGDPDWRANLARFLEIRAKRLDDIAERLKMGA